MNSWLLDTNIVSELSKDAPDAACVGWLRAHRGQCFVCTVTVAELALGIERLAAGRRKAELARQFAFSRRITRADFLILTATRRRSGAATPPNWKRNTERTGGNL